MLKTVTGTLIATIIVAACGSLSSSTVSGPGASESASSEAVDVQTVTSDGVPLYGTYYSGGLSDSSPLILLFHQGASNGRAEYEPLAEYFAASGYRIMAWDQRSGGEIHGGVNRTVATLPSSVPSGYCDTYPDLEAALAFARSAEDGPFIIWGSSYSAALVFRLAADYPEDIAAVLAFSPASGSPLADCLARMWIGDLKAPALALHPPQELERASAKQQREELEAAGVDYLVVENGEHGSSTLVDERTGHGMSAAREAVMDWLETALR